MSHPHARPPTHTSPRQHAETFAMQLTPAPSPSAAAAAATSTSAAAAAGRRSSGSFGGLSASLSFNNLRPVSASAASAAHHHASHDFSAAVGSSAYPSPSLLHAPSSSLRPMPRSASFGSFSSLDGMSRVLSARELRSYERSDGLTVESNYDEEAAAEAAATGSDATAGGSGGTAGAAGVGGRKRPVLLTTPRKLDAALLDRSPIPLSIHTIPLDSIAVPQWRLAAQLQQQRAALQRQAHENHARSAANSALLQHIPPAVSEDSSGSEQHSAPPPSLTIKPPAASDSSPSPHAPASLDSGHSAASSSDADSPATAVSSSASATADSSTGNVAVRTPTALARRASRVVFQSVAVQQLVQTGTSDNVALQEWIPKLLQSLEGVSASSSPAPLDLRGSNAASLLAQWVSDTLDVHHDDLLAVQVVRNSDSALAHSTAPLHASAASATSFTAAAPVAPASTPAGTSADAVSLLIDTSLAPPKLIGVVKVFSSHRSFEQEILALGRMHSWLDPPAIAAHATTPTADAAATAKDAEHTDSKDNAAQTAVALATESSASAVPAPTTPPAALSTSTSNDSCLLKVPVALGAHFALTPAGKGGVLVMSPAEGLPLEDWFVSLARASGASGASALAAAAAAAAGGGVVVTPVVPHSVENPHRAELFAQLLEGLRAAATAFFQLHTIPPLSGGKVRKKFIQRFVGQMETMAERITAQAGIHPLPRQEQSTPMVEPISPQADTLWTRFPRHHHLLDSTALLARLQPIVATALQSRGRACVVHGDANLANVFWEPATSASSSSSSSSAPSAASSPRLSAANGASAPSATSSFSSSEFAGLGHITLIDLPTVNQSVGDRGEPIGCAARDVASLFHKIGVAAAKHACTSLEAQKLQAHFFEQYHRCFAAAGMPSSVLSMETFHLFHLRSLLGELARLVDAAAAVNAPIPDPALTLAALHALDHGLVDAELFLARKKQAATLLYMHPRAGSDGLLLHRSTSSSSSSSLSPAVGNGGDGGDDDDARDDALAMQLLDEERLQAERDEEETRKSALAAQEIAEQDALTEAGLLGVPGAGAEEEERDLFDDEEELLAAYAAPPRGPYSAVSAAAGGSFGSVPSALSSSVTDASQLYTTSPPFPSRPLPSAVAPALPSLSSFALPGTTPALAAALQHQRSHQHAPKDTPGATPFVGTAGAGAYGYPPVAAPASAPSLSINGGRILVVLGAPLKADLCTPDVWLESRLKQTVSVFYRIQTGLSALILSGGRNSGQEVSVSKVMERWLRPFGIRTNSSRFALLNEDMSSCTSAETYPRDLVSQAFCVRSLLRVRGFRHGNLHVLCSDFQLASVATVFNRVFRSSTGLVSLEYIGSPTIRAYAPSADVEAARLKELPSIIKELRTAYASAPLYPYGRCSLLEASRAGSLQSLRLMVEGLGIGGSGFTGFGGGEALINSERDNLGCTSLHIAAECGFTDCCAYLLSHGADPNARSTLGATPLHYATAMNRLDVVELLLDYGAGPSRSVKGGCGRGVWLGSRRPADMHKFGVSPLSPIASSTHMLQESQPSTSVITLLVQPEAVSLADATEELRREHEREAQRKRRAMAVMHRSASNNAMQRSHSRQNSFDRAMATGGSSNTVLSADSGEFSVSLQAMGTSPPVSAPTSPHAKPPDGSAIVEATTTADRAVVLDHGLAPSEMQRLSSGPVSNGLLSVYPSLAGKRVYLLRHSESLWNVNGSHRVRGLIDTTLTNTGVKQAKQLQGLLQRTGALQRLGIRLIAVSPLTRTLQTYMLVARWYLDLFPSAPSVAAAGHSAAAALPATAAAGVGHSTASHLQQLAPPGPCAPPASPTPNTGASPCPVRVCVHPDLAEQLLSTGTIGRAPEQLAKDFSDPSLDFSALPPVWWYAPSKDELISESGGSGGGVASDEPTLPVPAANTKIYLKKEPVARLRRRIHSFLRWLEQQPETSILVVGHGTWFRQMVSLSDERELPDVFQRNLCMYVL